MFSFGLVLLVVAGNCAGDIFDFSEYDDPLQGYWNSKAFTLQTFSPLWTQATNINLLEQIHLPRNSLCTVKAADGSELMGVCKPKTECLFTGGTFSAKCGLTQACCTYISGCGSTTSERVSYFSSGTNPESQAQPCTYKIDARNKDICQIRLDFERMDLTGPPELNGNLVTKYACSEDSFTVNGIPNIPTLCGKNSGQHLYIPVNRGSNGASSITLSVKLATDRMRNNVALPKPDWFIRVRQLQCPQTANSFGFFFPDLAEPAASDQDVLAPAGCLQYFPNTFGTFKTFGFDGTNPVNSRYITDLRYSTCFKREYGDCGLKLTTNYFLMSPSQNNLCRDYIEIPGVYGTVADLDLLGRFCGDRSARAPEIITSNMGGPFSATFRSGDASDAASIGYEIQFQTMQTC